MKKTFWRLFYVTSLKLSGFMYAREEDNMGSRKDSEHRILVIGKAGNGKSSVCNTIVGSQRFKTGRGFAATTQTAQCEYVNRQGTDVRVVDTPDVTNIKMPQRQMEEEVGRWRELTRPYPTAVLLAVRCDIRYTAEEHAIYRQILRLWGDNSLTNNLMVAFTFGDCQDAPIAEELKTVCPELKSVLRDAGHRYFVFDNKADNRDEQAAQLLDYLETTATQGETLIPTRFRYLPHVLLGVAGVSGLAFAAAITAGSSRWATGFGLLFLFSGIALIVHRIKRKMN